MTDGPGTVLQRIIWTWLTSEPATWRDLLGRILIARVPENCGCPEMIEKMNEGGVSWCIKNRDAIVGLMVDNAVRGSRFRIGVLFRRQFREQADRWLVEAVKSSIVKD